jgi:hypothetical protein
MKDYMMRKDYIEELIIILENVRANIRERKINTKFHLREWVEVNECGTTCCAMGYATLDPEFQKRGLRLMGFSSTSTKDFVVKSAEDIANQYAKRGRLNSTLNFYIKYKDFDNFDAIKVFFGFERDGTASMLFLASRYLVNNKSLRNVIGRLRYLLKHGEIQFQSKYYWA